MKAFKKKKNSISDLPGGSVVKYLPYSAGDPGSIPGPGRLHLQPQLTLNTVKFKKQNKIPFHTYLPDFTDATHDVYEYRALTSIKF